MTTETKMTVVYVAIAGTVMCTMMPLDAIATCGGHSIVQNDTARKKGGQSE